MDNGLVLKLSKDNLQKITTNNYQPWSAVIFDGIDGGVSDAKF